MHDALADQSPKAEPQFPHRLPQANFDADIQSTAPTRPAGLKMHPISNDPLVFYVIPTSTECRYILAQAVFHQDNCDALQEELGLFFPLTTEQGLEIGCLPQESF